MKLEPRLPVAKNTKKTYLEEWTTLPHSKLAEAVKANNGGNVGLRLDNYFLLDPDCPEAEKFCNELDQNGELPTTVTWKTASGFTQRIYNPPPGRNHRALDIQKGMKLEVRHGTKMQSLLPPSYVTETKSGKPGSYEWVPGHSENEIEVADFPPELYERLQEMEKAGQTPGTAETSETGKPASLNFAEDGHNRDNSIYSVAVALRKSGMGEADILATVEAIAAGCGFSAKEAAAKVKSAMKETTGERNLSNEIRDFIEGSSGSFSTLELDRELSIASKQDKALRRKVLSNMVQDGKIRKESGKNGVFTKSTIEYDVMNPFKQIEYQEYPLIWPFNIHDYCYLYPGSVAVVAGAKDAGKTSILLNIAMLNSGQKITYFNSEMPEGELHDRLKNFDLPKSNWQHVEWIGGYDSQSVEHIIRPDNLNIIDYLEEPEKSYLLGIQISKIQRKLKTGVAVIGLQKNQGQEHARGGESTMQKSRIYLTLDNNEAKILSGKLWKIKRKNPKGIIWRYKLLGGAKVII